MMTQLMEQLQKNAEGPTTFGSAEHIDNEDNMGAPNEPEEPQILAKRPERAPLMSRNLFMAGGKPKASQHSELKKSKTANSRPIKEGSFDRILPKNIARTSLKKVKTQSQTPNSDVEVISPKKAKVSFSKEREDEDSMEVEILPGYNRMEFLNMVHMQANALEKLSSSMNSDNSED